MGIGAKRGAALANMILESCISHTASLSIEKLRCILASVCGDGGLTIGGPSHRHHSSSAAEKLWRLVHPEPAPMCTTWDAFHRVDNSVWRAIKSVPLADESFNVAKRMEVLFGMGDGVMVLRGVAAHMGGQTPARLVCPGGTRKVAYLSKGPGNLLANLKHFITGIWARIAWAQAGFGAHTLQDLMEDGRRLQDVGFVAFQLILESLLMNCVRPLAKQTQACVAPEGNEYKVVFSITEISS
jgi:hypothetical protein